MKKFNFTTSKPARLPDGNIVPTHFIYGMYAGTAYVINPDNIRGGISRIGIYSRTHWISVTHGEKFDEISQYVLSVLDKYPDILPSLQGKPHDTTTSRDLSACTPKDRQCGINRIFRMRPDTGTRTLTQRTDYRELTAEAHWNFSGSASQRACNMRYDNY